jgi:hypothetical protein
MSARVRTNHLESVSDETSKREAKTAFAFYLIAISMSLTSLSYWPKPVMAEEHLLHYPAAIGLLYLGGAVFMIWIALRMSDITRLVLSSVAGLMVLAASLGILIRTASLVGVFE